MAMGPPFEWVIDEFEIRIVPDDDLQAQEVPIRVDPDRVSL
jgi:hypothetical protein